MLFNVQRDRDKTDPSNFKNLNSYAPHAERRRPTPLSRREDGGEEERRIYNYIYIRLYRGWNARRDIPAGQRHGFMNGGPRKKQAVGQLVPVDSDNCVARAGIRGQNESTLAC